MKQQYNTKQKNAVLDCLAEQTSRSLTVDGVLAALAARGERIGRSTVYRRLEELCREGYARRFAPEEGRSVTYRFIGSGCGEKSHFHLICSACGVVYHTHCPEMEAIFQHVADEHGFAVDTQKTVLYGVCENCRGGKNK